MILHPRPIAARYEARGVVKFAFSPLRVSSYLVPTGKGAGEGDLTEAEGFIEGLCRARLCRQAVGWQAVLAREMAERCVPSQEYCQCRESYRT